MAREPTDRQRAVFDFVCQAIRREGRPPTVREIADHFGFGSPKAASDHLAALERKGYISRRRGTSRNIDVAEKLDPRGIPVVQKIDPDVPVLRLGDVDSSLNVTTLFEVDQKTIALQVKDTSMEAAGIREGDYVIVQAGEQIKDGSIGAVQVEGEPLVRRVSFEANMVKWADQASPVSRDAEGFQIVGPVKGVVRRL